MLPVQSTTPGRRRPGSRTRLILERERGRPSPNRCSGELVADKARVAADMTRLAASMPGLAADTAELALTNQAAVRTRFRYRGLSHLNRGSNQRLRRLRHWLRRRRLLQRS